MRKDQRRAQQLSSEMRGLADNSATAKLLEAVQRARLKFDAARYMYSKKPRAQTSNCCSSMLTLCAFALWWSTG